MIELFNGLKNIRMYIDDLSIISNKSFGDHINRLDKVLSKLKYVGFKVNTEKSFFTRNELEYLGLRITRENIMPLPNKVDVIKNIAVPTTKNQIGNFIGLINYYTDMWQHRSEILIPLSGMTPKQAKYNLNKEYQNAFDTIKKIRFPIQTLTNDLKSTSKLQLESVIG